MSYSSRRAIPTRGETFGRLWFRGTLLTVAVVGLLFLGGSVWVISNGTWSADLIGYAVGILLCLQVFVLIFAVLNVGEANGGTVRRNQQDNPLDRVQAPVIPLSQRPWSELTQSQRDELEARRRGDPPPPPWTYELRRVHEQGKRYMAELVAARIDNAHLVSAAVEVVEHMKATAGQLNTYQHKQIGALTRTMMQRVLDGNSASRSRGVGISYQVAQEAIAEYLGLVSDCLMRR